MKESKTKKNGAKTQNLIFWKCSPNFGQVSRKTLFCRMLFCFDLSCRFFSFQEFEAILKLQSSMFSIKAILDDKLRDPNITTSKDILNISVSLFTVFFPCSTGCHCGNIRQKEDFNNC